MKARDRMAIPTNTPTRYEVALMRGNEVLHVLGYTAKKSKQGIYALCTVNLEPYLTAQELQESKNFEMTYTTKYGFQIGSNLFVRFTGRTERAIASLA